MKNLLTSSVLVLFASSLTAFAEGKVAMGVQGGLTFPDYQFKNTSPSRQYDKKDGWLGGVYGEFGFWAITLRPELNYVTKPYSVANLATVKNYYLEVPVLVKINPLTDFVLSPFLVLGPQWSKHVKSEVSTIAGTTSYANTVDGWDILGVTGLGLEANVMENLALNVQGRYAHGFRDIDSSSATVKTRGFYALAGIALQNAF